MESLQRGDAPESALYSDSRTSARQMKAGGMDPDDLEDMVKNSSA